MKWRTIIVSLYILYIYNERQKKLITSSDRATLTKIHHIKINHVWTQISYSTPYSAHIRKQRFLLFFCQRGEKVKSQEVIFQKSQKLLASRAWSSHQTKAS